MFQKIFGLFCKFAVYSISLLICIYCCSFHFFLKRSAKLESTRPNPTLTTPLWIIMLSSTSQLRNPTSQEICTIVKEFFALRLDGKPRDHRAVDGAYRGSNLLAHHTDSFCPPNRQVLAPIQSNCTVYPYNLLFLLHIRV